ncbi:MAG: hypothetical protein R2789_11095 [Microthrixaceae bacterium]
MPVSLRCADLESPLQPLPRCIETVEPLAQKLGLAVEVHDALREGADPALTWSLIEDLGPSTVVMCSHGDVIPEILDRSERREPVWQSHVGSARVRSGL